VTFLKEGSFLEKIFGNKSIRNENSNNDTSAKDASLQQPQFVNQIRGEELSQLISSINAETKININDHEGKHRQLEQITESSPYISEKEVPKSKVETKIIDFKENEERNVRNEKDEKIAALESEIAELRRENRRYSALEDKVKMLDEIINSKFNSPHSQVDLTESSNRNVCDESFDDSIVLEDTSENVDETTNQVFAEVEEISVPETLIPKDDGEAASQVDVEHLVNLEDTPLEGVAVQIEQTEAVDDSLLADIHDSEDPGIQDNSQCDENTSTQNGSRDSEEEVVTLVENEDNSLQVSIEEKFAKLSNQIFQLNQEITQKFKVDESKDKIIDNLHRELQGFKDNQTKDFIKPIILELIQMMDRTKKQADEFESAEELNPKKLVNVIKNLVQDIEDILYRQGIDSYNCETEAFDAKRQQIARTIKVDDPSKDKTVAEVVGNGYIWDEKIIRSERVKVYVYDQTKTKINAN
jgi:molecular chaperone GrpE